jgi:hypothetical protein
MEGSFLGVAALTLVTHGHPCECTRYRCICGEAEMDPTDEPSEKDGPDHTISPPAAIFGLERLLLVLAVLSAALVFVPLTAETALLHWDIIGSGHEFVALLRKFGFWSCLVCMAASWLLEKEKAEGGHQAIIFGLLAALLLATAWAIETLVPFEGWWQALRLTPAVVYGGLAYAFLAKSSGRDPALPDDEEA